MNQDEAGKKAKLADNLKKEIEFWQKLDKEFADADDLLKLSENDEKLEQDLSRHIAELEESFNELELRTLFTGQYDNYNAVLAIHAGAGGTDAQDFAEMLLRMYLRFTESKGWDTDLISKSEGGEAGIKSAVLEVKGEKAYGFLKNEAGVHRLVRLSPYNPSHTRETSFALVEVLPEIPQKELEIDEKDLNIEANTSSGHGGQSVNTTYSAIRITHIPTNITVSIQNERSQHQNKEKAMEVLRARLAKRQEEEHQKEKKAIRGEFHSPEWGNQIRSYVLHPYKLVKDHRTDYETSDVEKVLDGDLDTFIEKNLQSNKLTP
ncbi:MAG: peptide chain release factor 2 [Candidatus Doudnabacteria bacterium RIFCSPHIGHO2_02_FULL_46_11]|uniref:Peptide chain release factor 2 n=1 Tax=Candidatus Doudnabacteria bacterium RIFCSPHIGHO2_02_FULL_46_11 TaxID=1817832 RepID=A0A1F5PAA1_9BACT|nr:MAG: peptide chain release factor 2 [Candidatus Doudnabacteria bacterium RIFCSPHIGHO2_02_FULL_46_11]